MKIALALEATLDSNAGVQQIIKGLGRFLIKSGHDVTFITPYSEGSDEFEGRIISLGRAYRPFFNTTSIPVGIYSSAKTLRQATSKNYDILHTSLPVSPFSIGKMLTLTDTPTVGTFMSHSCNRLHRYVIKTVSRVPTNISDHVDTITVPNTLTEKDARYAIPGSYTIIPHATDLDTYSSSTKPLEKFSNSRPKLLFLGRLENRKGVQHLITAMPYVISKIPDVQLIIAGEGPLRKKLEAMADKHNIRKNITFEGYIDEELKPRYYASADLCVFPATYGESFGIVLAEALASGKIPISFANEGYRCVLADIPEALVENKDVDALSNKIVSLLSDKQTRTALEKKCLRVAQRYTWDSVGKQYLDLYEKVLRKRAMTDDEEG